MECGACWDGRKQTASLLQHPKDTICVGVMDHHCESSIDVYNFNEHKMPLSIMFMSPNSFTAVHIIMGFNAIWNIPWILLDCCNLPWSYLIWWASQTHLYKKRLKFERPNNCLKGELGAPCKLQSLLRGTLIYLAASSALTHFPKCTFYTVAHTKYKIISFQLTSSKFVFY